MQLFSVDAIAWIWYSISNWTVRLQRFVLILIQILPIIYETSHASEGVKPHGQKKKSYSPHRTTHPCYHPGQDGCIHSTEPHTRVTIQVRMDVYTPQNHTPVLPSRSGWMYTLHRSKIFYRAANVDYFSPRYQLFYVPARVTKDGCALKLRLLM